MSPRGPTRTSLASVNYYLRDVPFDLELLCEAVNAARDTVGLSALIFVPTQGYIADQQRQSPEIAISIAPNDHAWTWAYAVDSALRAGYQHSARWLVREINRRRRERL